MPYYLGIDGGGSKTTCAVGDDTSRLATATAGPSNIVRVGEAQARESLHQGVRQACTAAGITPDQITCTCIGAAGAARANVEAILHRLLGEILRTPIEVVNDANIALEAAFDAGPGVIVIAGTGSIAYGRDANGATARAGGWGFAISDEGSAHWISRTAIGAALREIDLTGTNSLSRNDTGHPLLAAFMKAWGVASLDDLVRAANSTPGPDFSALFPIVVSVAESGDAIARSVLAQAGKELAKIAGVVIQRLFPASSNSTSSAETAVVPLAMAGGVFRHAPPACEVFYNEVRALDSRAAVKGEVINPVEGALQLARKAAGIMITKR